MSPIDRTDRTLIIGAGPAGLSAGAALKGRGQPFDIVDTAPRVGGIWDIDRPETPMYEAAHFISSKTLSGFPGFPMPAEYPDYPGHRLVLRYIQAYAEHHGLAPDIELGVRVVSATTHGPGPSWHVTLSTGEERRYAALCLATGTTWHPHMPQLPGTFEGETYHSFQFRSADEFRGKRVLVVGGGNSGCDIACEAARTADRAFISLRRGYHFVPKYVLGRPADMFARAGPKLPAWLEERVFGLLVGRILVGDLTRYGLPKPDHRILQSHPIMNTRILHHFGHGDLVARSGIKEVRAHSVVFDDGTQEEIDLIVMATGYDRAFPFLQLDGGGPSVAPSDLYLELFHREHRSLFCMGLFETDGAAYGLLGLQAELVAAYVADRGRDGAASRQFDGLRRMDHPDLRGGRRYLPTRRHEHYVNAAAYEVVLRRVMKRFELS
jgi:cation diffusion facilitator CzcD-associated flavoprotein CzcO